MTRPTRIVIDETRKILHPIKRFFLNHNYECVDFDLHTEFDPPNITTL